MQLESKQKEKKKLNQVCLEILKLLKSKDNLYNFASIKYFLHEFYALPAHYSFDTVPVLRQYSSNSSFIAHFEDHQYFYTTTKKTDEAGSGEEAGKP